MSAMTNPYEWQGRTMFGSDGEKIGKITEIYEDPATGRPEWATVSSGLFGNRHNFVPLDGATPAGDVVRARVTSDQVKDAPGVENEDELSEQEERRLFTHYGITYGAQRSTLSGDEADTGEPTAEASMARSDAHSRGGDDEARQPRLRRYVVTERVIVEVPVTRSEVRVEREPDDDEGRPDPLHGSLARDEEPWATEDAPRRRGER